MLLFLTSVCLNIYRHGSTSNQIQYRWLSMKAWRSKTLKNLQELFRWVCCVLKNRPLYVLPWHRFFKCLEKRMPICRCHLSLLSQKNPWKYLHHLNLPGDNLLVYLIYVHSTVLEQVSPNDSFFIFIGLSFSLSLSFFLSGIYVCMQFCAQTGCSKFNKLRF